MQVKAVYSGINHSVIRTSLKLGHPAYIIRMLPIVPGMHREISKINNKRNRQDPYQTGKKFLTISSV